MGKIKNEQRKQDILYHLLFAQYKNVAVSIFKWEGLPDNMRSERIEKQLFEKGHTLFFEDNELGFLTLPTAKQGLNVYGEPVTFIPYGVNYHGQIRSRDNAVLIKNNELQLSDAPILDYYVKQIVDIELTVAVNRDRIKTPYILEGDEKTLQSMKQFYRQINANEPVLYTQKNFSKEALAVHPTPTEYIGDKMAMQEHEYKNKIYEFLGLNNANTDKKERLVVDEVNANNEQVVASLNARLRQRQEAVEKINGMYNLNITVDIADAFKLDKQDEQTEKQEVDDDGNTEQPE